MRTHRQLPALLLATTLALVACGSDPADEVGDVAEEVGDVAEDAGDDLGEVVDEAAEALDDAGVDTERDGVATATLNGDAYTFQAAESFGCFLLEDGGSQGAISFDGTDDAGNELSVDWAGDSPDSVMAEITVDGTTWRNAFGADVEATPGNDEASFSTTVLLPDSTEGTLDVEISC